MMIAGLLFLMMMTAAALQTQPVPIHGERDWRRCRETEQLLLNIEDKICHEVAAAAARIDKWRVIRNSRERKDAHERSH